MVTVAVRRVPLDRSSESFLDYLNPALQILPNTAGCYSTEDAVRTARLAREALQTDLVKLEVIGDQTTLFQTTNKHSKPRASSSKRDSWCCLTLTTI